jgi:RHS repeat-associated protein
MLQEGPESITDAKGETTLFTYDALGRVATEILPGSGGAGSGGTATYTYGYDLDGDLLTATDSLGHTTSYSYNALNEKTSVENADGDTTGFTYDGDGNVLTVTDGLSHTTSYTYNDRGEVLTQVQPSGGGTTAYTYDLAGRLTSLTDADSDTTTYAYNKANELVTEKSPTGGLTTTTYDLAGNTLSVTDPDNHTISYSYDADNEENTETWMNPSGGSPLNVVTYTYNADGDVTQVQDDVSKYEYGYNADNEVTSQSNLGTTGVPTVTLTYAYDADGDRTSMDDSLGGLVSYTYDNRDELINETLSGSGSGTSPEAVKNTYDIAGNMIGQTRYSNLAETTVVAVTSYTYDNANQMTGITDNNSGGTTLVSFGYTYDAAGLVSQETRHWASGASTDTLTYGYTNNDQLTSVTHTNGSFSNESFSYDANGNETGTGFTTTTGNEQTASPGYTYTYDANGNMITSTQTSTGDVWTYSYDFRNRMTGAVEKTSGGTVLAQATYTYDALDNRIGMDENGTQTWTLYDGSDPVMDFNGSGSLEMRYLNGPTGDIVDAVLARESAGGTIAWYLPDRLGTIRDLINNSGSVIDHVDYSAFGTVLDESSPTSGDRMMGFAGMERDTVTGLNLAVNRVQDPGTGRWTSRDPLGFAAGDANLYRYVGNGPVGLIDPSGLDAVAQLPLPDLPPNVFAPAPPDVRIVVAISTGVIKEMQKSGRFKNGPCEDFAFRMTNILKDKKIDFKLHFYKVAPGATEAPVAVWTNTRTGKKNTDSISARSHVIVEVTVTNDGKTEIIFLDAGWGYATTGNFGNFQTGVIDPVNRNLKDKNTGKDLLVECDPSEL